MSLASAADYDAICEMIDRFEEQELEVFVYPGVEHDCETIQSIEVPEISLIVENLAWHEECDGCREERAQDAAIELQMEGIG